MSDPKSVRRVQRTAPRQVLAAPPANSTNRGLFNAPPNPLSSRFPLPDHRDVLDYSTHRQSCSPSVNPRPVRPSAAEGARMIAKAMRAPRFGAWLLRSRGPTAPNEPSADPRSDGRGLSPPPPSLQVTQRAAPTSTRAAALARSQC
jgi:hypothetical protein